jgi:methionyl-tRNA formyltransferase
MRLKRVVVLSPNPYSLYTLATLTLLASTEVAVVGVGLRRLVNPRRFLVEARRDGARLLRKIWSKLLWRGRSNAAAAGDSLSALLTERAIHRESIPAFCGRSEIPIRHCYDFNDPDFVGWVEASAADAIVFTGGGLLRKPLLAATAKGVLNCHMGILPRYRGMDLPEWAVLCGDTNNIGCSVHVMDSGVDTGPILAVHHVPLQKGDSLNRLRDRIEYHMPSVLVRATAAYLEGALEARPQTQADGKQFFIMSPVLKEVAEYRLTNDSGPTQ